VEGQDEPVVILERRECSCHRPTFDCALQHPVRVRHRHVQLDETATPAGCACRRAYDMSPEPRTEGSRIAEPIQPLPRREQRVLDGIGAVGMRARQDDRGAQCCRQMRLDQPAERVAVAAPRAGHQRAVYLGVQGHLG
jgi:hypothetical protein